MTRGTILELIMRFVSQAVDLLGDQWSRQSRHYWKGASEQSASRYSLGCLNAMLENIWSAFLQYLTQRTKRPSRQVVQHLPVIC